MVKYFGELKYRPVCPVTFSGYTCQSTNGIQFMGKITTFTIAVLLFIVTGAQADPLCFDEAGAQYGINPQILQAIAKVESDFNPRATNWNRNGTYDFGLMQINSSWAPALGKERWNALGDVCTNIKTGAMILADCMKRYGYTWEAIGCYNSRTPDKRDRYAWLVFRQLQRIQRDDKERKDNPEAAREQPAFPFGEEPALPETHGVELTASSTFEGTTNGL